MDKYRPETVYINNLRMISIVCISFQQSNTASLAFKLASMALPLFSTVSSESGIFRLALKFLNFRQPLPVGVRSGTTAVM